MRFRRRTAAGRDESGYAAVLVALVVATVGIASAAIAVDTGQWYVEVQKVQKAADAAALGGVPFLPQDFASARARALSIAAANGYDNDGTTNAVTVTQGNPATQLEVNISSTIANQFGAMIGVGGTSVARSATADFQGPAPMGSPCNTFGNEPDPGSGPSSPRPTGTALGANIPQNCSRTPAFWANVEGPETGKVQGDRYQTRTCENGSPGSPAIVDGCTAANVNSEYNDFGYVFLVKVQEGYFNKDANGRPTTAKAPITLQLYDPAFMSAGQKCLNPNAGNAATAGLPPSQSYVRSGPGNLFYTLTDTFANDSAATNPWVTNSDARSRYTSDGPGSASFCNGDNFPGSTAANNPGSPTLRRVPVTSFVLREQTDTLNPRLAAPVSSACTRQYGGKLLPTTTYYPQSRTTGSYTAVNANVFKQGVAGYDAQVAQLFHNWTEMCTFTPTRPGDYYLQVRTNVSLGGTVNGIVSSSNTAAQALTGNSTTGGGSNAFAIRAVTGGTGLQRMVSISGNDHMPIYVNKDSGTAEFNLIRVLPGARGQKISFSYFDAGDSEDSGTVRVLPPTDITGSGVTTPFPGGCTSYGGSADTGTATTPSTISNCAAPFVKTSTASNAPSKNNGRTQTITIPIPTDYSCGYTDFSKCWYRVQVAFGSGSVGDVTTWDATILGDPVRLIK